MRRLLTTLLLFVAVSAGCSTAPESSASAGSARPYGIPFPDDRGASSQTQYLLLGKQAEQRSAGASDSGNALQLTATANDSAFGIYRFNPQTAPDNVQVSLGDGTTAWIGLADFTRHLWSLSGPYTASQVFALTAAHHVSPAGNIYLAVIAPAGGSAVVDQLLLFAANVPPVAAFTPTVSSGDAPLTVDFDASASEDPDGSIALYEWDVDNDGQYEVDGGGTPTTQHLFGTPGSYPVSLRVTDTGGDGDTHSATISVQVPPPVASFTVTPQQQINPLVLNYHFDAAASYDPLGGPLTYDWDFEGDGTWDVLDGAALQDHSYPSIGVYPAQLRVTNESLLVATATETVYCPSVWSSFSGPPGCTTRVSPVVGAQTNNVKWSFVTASQIHASPALGADGTVYISSFDHNLYALLDNGTATPTVRWTFNLGPDLPYGGPAVGADGTVYIGSVDGNTYALTDNGTATPTVKWSYPTGNVPSSPCIGPDGTVYIGTSSPENTVYALLDNGTPTATVKWSFVTGDSIRSSPTLGPDGTLYIGSSDEHLYALVDNGTPTPTVKWSFTAGGLVHSTPAIGPDGTVYIGSEDDNVYALADNGTPTPTVKWSFATGSFGSVYSSPAVGPDGTVYIGSMDKNIYALEDNGTPTPTVKWAFTTSAGIAYASPVIGADGTVYISSGSKLYALIDNGTPTPTVKWIAAGTPLFGSVALGADGTVYCGDANGTVRAFGP